MPRLTWAVRVCPLRVAVMLAVAAAVIVPAVALKDALPCPEAIVTVDGAVRAFKLLDTAITVAFVAG